MQPNELVIKDVVGLTIDDKMLIVDAIAQFGEGDQHPVPTDESVDYFRAEYARECVLKAQADASHPELHGVAERLSAALDP